MLTLLLLTTALASKSPPTNDPCAENLEGWSLAVSHATAATSAEALQKARDDAEAALNDRFCGDTSDFGKRRCAAVKRWVQPWTGKVLKESRRQAEACATAAIPMEFLDALERDAAAMRKGMDEVAAAASPHLAGDALYLHCALSDGTGAGLLGDAVLAEFDRRLAASGAARRVEPQPGVWSLRLSIAPGTAGHQATAHLVGGTEYIVLGGFPIPDDIYSESIDELGKMRTDEQLGLEGGARRGDVDLTLSTPGFQGVIPSGSEVSFVVRANEAARARLFSVWPDGTTAFLGELAVPAGGSSKLGPVRAIRKGEGQERVVAVAVPNGSTFGALEAPSDYCKLADPLSAAVYPPSATVAALAVRITGVPSEPDPVPDCP